MSRDGLKIVQDKLEEKAQEREKKEGGHIYFTNADLMPIWDDPRLSEFFSQLSKQEKLVSTGKIKEHLLKTISILAYIGWNEWDTLSDIIFPRGSYESSQHLDKNLPYLDRETLKHSDFFGDDFWSKKFFENQFYFSPVELKEGKDDKKYYSKIQLPICNECTEKRTGSYGTVTEITVEKGFYVDKRGEKSHKEKTLARKRMDNLEDFEKEIAILKILQNNGTTHRSIMMHSLSFKHGEKYYIFFEWADYTLQDLLDGKCDGEDSFNITPKNLIKEASKLADALSFLHNMGQKLFIMHMDLKPNNILVKVGDNMPVGAWLITDFGLSCFIKGSNPLEPLQSLHGQESMPATSLRKPERPAGAFQPPEIKDKRFNRRGDVWSFGCILTHLFAFALGGSSLVQDLTRCLLKTDRNDYFYQQGSVSKKFSKPDTLKWILKPNFRNWIEQVVSDRRYSEHHLWAGEMKNLILQTLEIDPEMRPRSDEVNSRLNNIKRIIDSKGKERARSFNDNTSESDRAPASLSQNDGSDWTSYPSSSSHSTIPYLRPGQQMTQMDTWVNLPPPSTLSKLFSKDALIPPEEFSFKLSLPPGKLLDVCLSPCGNRVMFLSKKAVYIYNIERCTNQSSPIQKLSEGWHGGCIAGDFVVLRGKDIQLREYHHGERKYVKTKVADMPNSSNTKPSNSFDVLCVSLAGDLAIKVDKGLRLCYRSGKRYATKEMGPHNSDNEHLVDAKFGATGKYLHGCSYDANKYHVYVWDAKSDKPEPVLHVDTRRDTVDKIDLILVPSIAEATGFAFVKGQQKAMAYPGNPITRVNRSITAACVIPKAEYVTLLSSFNPTTIDVARLDSQNGSYTLGTEINIWSSKKFKISPPKGGVPLPSMALRAVSESKIFSLVIVNTEGHAIMLEWVP